MHTCERCHGTGRVVEVQRTIFGQMQTQATCPACNGQGQVIDRPCETCEGQGRTPSREKVEVEVPAGVHSGQTLTIEGKGEAGLRGDACGSLVVSVEVTESERFERQGDDLYCTVTVDALQAIVGTAVSVDGILEGEQVTVSVPAGCQFGQRVVVEGHGMPRLGMAARGNLVAVVSDGTAVLGLGNIGPEAGLPVMEGKAVLFKRFADIDSIPLCLGKVFNDKFAFFKLCKALPDILDDVITEDPAAMLTSTVYDELDKTDFYKSLYMLAFKTYEGFENF